MRGDVGRGVRIAPLVIALLGVTLGACEPEVPVELRPDGVLRASLGLTDRDVVHIIQVRGRGVAEIAEPDDLRIQPGAWVSFQGGDTRGHVVRFDTLALAPAALDWVRQTDQVESPPLLTPASRWVVSFAGAPEGVYPFAVEGSGELGFGRIELRTESR
jgi:hypothetical protein